MAVVVDAAGNAPAAGYGMMGRVRVTEIGRDALVLRIGDEELRLPYDKFPWFRQPREDRLQTVEWARPDHLLWPRIGVELSVHFIRRMAEPRGGG